MKYNTQYKGARGFASGFQEAQEAYQNMSLIDRILKKPIGKVQVEPVGKTSYVWWNKKK